jgi:hypothetical protein
VYLEFNNYADVITAFHSNKIDAFSTDESIYKAMLWEGQKVDRIDEALSLSDYGLIFGKGENLQLQQQINEYIAKIKADGTHQTLEQKWFGDSEPAQFESYSDLSADGKVLRVGISSASKPFVYEKNGFTIVIAKLILGFFDDISHVFFSGCCGIDLGKHRLGDVRNDPGDRRFSCPGRSVEDDRSQFIGRNSPIQELILSEDMLLTDNLIKRLRPHTKRKRRR